MKTTDTLPKFHLLVVLAVAALGLLLAWGIPQYSHAKAARHNKVKHSNIATEIKTDALAKPVIAPAAHPSYMVNALVQPVAPPVYVDTVPAAKQSDSIKKTHVHEHYYIVDDNGNKRTYHSLSEMPQADKDAFLKENPNFNSHWNDSSFASLRNFKMDPAFQQQMADMSKKLKKQFNSPEWRKQMNDMKVKMNKQFNSPEWKKQMADMHATMKDQFNNPEWKKQMEDMQGKIKEQYNSPEWKKQMEDMHVKMKEQFNNPEWKKQMADMQLKMKEQFNNPEWKKQMADMQLKMKEQFNSPEWKKQMQDMKIKMKDFNQERVHELERQNEEMREELRKKGDHKFDETEKDTVK